MTEKYIGVNQKNTTKQAFHTDRDCVRIKATPRPVSDAVIEYHELTLCQYCDPDVTVERGQGDMGHYEALKEAAKDE